VEEADQQIEKFLEQADVTWRQHALKCRTALADKVFDKQSNYSTYVHIW